MYIYTGRKFYKIFYEKIIKNFIIIFNLLKLLKLKATTDYPPSTLAGSTSQGTSPCRSVSSPPSLHPRVATTNQVYSYFAAASQRPPGEVLANDISTAGKLVLPSPYIFGGKSSISYCGRITLKSPTYGKS